MKSGTLILVVGVIAVGGIWLYTRSKTAAVVPAGSAGGGGLLSSLENLGVSTGAGLAGQGINAGVSALGNIGGSSSDGDGTDDGSDDSGG
jgi:hypothetical protein